MDPELPAIRTRPIFLPRVNPRLAVLTPLALDLFGGPDFVGAAPSSALQTTEGAYLDLGALSPARQALLLRGDGEATGFVLVLDSLFEDRIDAARRLHRSLTGRRAEAGELTAYRRSRLKLAFRAVDAREDGAGYREIARGLFPLLHGRDREPSDVLVARAVRLVRYGSRLVNGGYLDLLRPERRAPKSRRK